MPNLLFASGFEGGVGLSAPYDIQYHEAWQDVVGTDSETGYTWPADMWGGRSAIQMLTMGGNLPDVISNSIESVAGHDGGRTRALHLEVLHKPSGITQDPLLLLPRREPGDFYVSEWVKLPANLGQLLGPGGWMTVGPEWKTAGDFRVVSSVVVDGAGRPYWEMKWDTDANGGVPLQTFWIGMNRSVAVPQGEWFHVEFFSHRGDADGRVWLKVNGRTVVDHVGDNVGVNNAAINRIFLANPYANKPVDLWVDDIQVWDGVPDAVLQPAPERQSPAPQPAPRLPRSPPRPRPSAPAGQPPSPSR